MLVASTMMALALAATPAAMAPPTTTTAMALAPTDDQGLAEIVLDGLVGKEVTDAIPRGEARRRAFRQLVATPVLHDVAIAFREPGFDAGADYVHEHAHD